VEDLALHLLFVRIKLLKYLFLFVMKKGPEEHSLSLISLQM
jgi:hypothetical protein